MKKALTILGLLISFSCFGQNAREIFVPIKLTYYPGHQFRIPWEEEVGKDIWIRILTYPMTNPRDSRALYTKDKTEYNKKANRMLYTRNECDSLVKDYLARLIKTFSYYNQYGQGAYYIQEKSGDRMYQRCTCLPASAIKDLGHGDVVVVGVPIKYIEPKDFVFKFKKYKLDSLDLAEAPYYTIFPMDITPSFDCSKASTPIERAICRNAELATLDRDLLMIYNEALKAKGEVVKNQQKVWVQQRDKKCDGKNNDEITKILNDLYNSRINELKRLVEDNY